MRVTRSDASGTVRHVARRTKIIATIGPACSDEETLAEMMRAGMDVARISLAHTPLEAALEKHRRIRKVAAELGVVVATMIDLPGPMIRIGRTSREGIQLKTGATVTLVGGNEQSTAEQIYVDYSHLIDDCDVGDRISIGDGEEVVVLVDSVACRSGHHHGRVGRFTQRARRSEHPVRNERPRRGDR